MDFATQNLAQWNYYQNSNDDENDFDSSYYEEDQNDSSLRIKQECATSLMSTPQTPKPKNRWTKEEDDLLNRLCEQYPSNGKDWKQISMHFKIRLVLNINVSNDGKKYSIRT